MESLEAALKMGPDRELSLVTEATRVAIPLPLLAIMIRIGGDRRLGLQHISLGLLNYFGTLCVVTMTTQPWSRRRTTSPWPGNTMGTTARRRPQGAADRQIHDRDWG